MSFRGYSAAPTPSFPNLPKNVPSSAIRPAYETRRGIDLAQAPGSIHSQQHPHTPSQGVRMETLQRLVQDHIGSNADNSASTLARSHVLQAAPKNSFPGQLSYFAPAPLRIVDRSTVTMNDINTAIGLPGSSQGGIVMEGDSVLRKRPGFLDEISDDQNPAQKFQSPIGTGRPRKAKNSEKHLLGSLDCFDTQLPPLNEEESEDAVSETAVYSHATSVPANIPHRQLDGDMASSLCKVKQQAPQAHEGCRQDHAEFFRQGNLHHRSSPSLTEKESADVPAQDIIKSSNKTDNSLSTRPLAHNGPFESIEDITAWPTPAEWSQTGVPLSRKNRRKQRKAWKRMVSAIPSTPPELVIRSTPQQISPHSRQQSTAPNRCIDPFSYQLPMMPVMPQSRPHALQQFAAPAVQYADTNHCQQSTPQNVLQGTPYVYNRYSTPLLPLENPRAFQYFPVLRREYPQQQQQQQSLMPTLPSRATYTPQHFPTAVVPFMTAKDQRDDSRYGITVGGIGHGANWNPPISKDGQSSSVPPNGDSTST